MWSLLFLFLQIVSLGAAVVIALAVAMYGLCVVIARVCHVIFRRRLHTRFRVIPLPRG